MGVYGCIRVYTGVYGCIRVYTGVYGCIRVYTGVYGLYEVVYLRNELKSAVTGIYSLPPFDCNAP